MLSEAPTEGEQQPLLQPQPPRSRITTYLFWLSSRQLWGLLFITFVVHLIATKTYSEWSTSLWLTIQADVLYVAALIITLFITVFFCYIWRATATLSSCCFVLSTVVLFATTVWYIALRISILHQLSITCWLPSVCLHSSRNHSEPDLEGILHWFTSWFWFPSGLFECGLAVIWRPWWFAFYAAPRSIFGLTPHVWSLPFAQAREIIVGSVWQPSLLGLVVAGLAVVPSLFWVAGLALGFSLLLAAVPFYLTSAPIAAFWSFLGQVWLHFASSIASRKGTPSPEEWVALLLMLLGMVRGIVTVASVRLEEWNARQHVQDILVQAVEHPFRAELEQGFGDPEATPGLLASLGKQMVQESRSNSDKNISTLNAKRKALVEEMQARRGDSAIVQGRLQLYVNREQLLEDSLCALVNKPGSELLAPGMSVHFAGEIGADAGGLTKDWFDSVARALVEGAEDASGASWLAMAADQTLVPRPGPQDYERHKDLCDARYLALVGIGRFLALAVIREKTLPLSFSTLACKHLLGKPVGLADVQQLDPEFFRGRVQAILKEGGLEELEKGLGEPLKFMSAPSELYRHSEELKEGGASIVVTEDNKAEYVELLCEAYLCNGMRREMKCLLRGFWDLLPSWLLKHYRVAPRELSLLISGVAELDPKEWAKYSTGSSTTRVHKWFWEVVEELNPEQRSMLLHFATGSSRLPPGGFADLRPAFNVIVASGAGDDRLPSAHTCSNQLVLQDYTSKQQLREKLLIALSTEGFDLV